MFELPPPVILVYSRYLWPAKIPLCTLKSCFLEFWREQKISTFPVEISNERTHWTDGPLHLISWWKTWVKLFETSTFKNKKCSAWYLLGRTTRYYLFVFLILLEMKARPANLFKAIGGSYKSSWQNNHVGMSQHWEPLKINWATFKIIVTFHFTDWVIQKKIK